MRQRQATEAAPVTPTPELALAHGRAEPRTRVRNMHRFRVGVTMLLSIGICSLVAAIVLSTHGRTSHQSGGWSVFSPQDDGLPGAQEIANYVAPYYRASPAQQLAVVTALNLNDPNKPVQVAVPAAGSPGGLVPLPAGSTIVYNLCGLGSKNCSIGVGHPSAARLLLLRRESLELALYTFKYISGINTVVAILPPGRTTQGCVGICPKPQHTVKTTPTDVALAFDHSELQPWLNRPLRDVLPESLPPTVAQMTHAGEAELVQLITAHGLFQERVEQGQDGSSVVVLSPMTPQ